MTEAKLQELTVLAAKIRRDVLKMLKHRGYGHAGGALSIVEVLADIYGNHLRFDAKNPKWEDRDMVVLSKGHAGPGLYSTLCNCGFFEEDVLYTLNDGGTILPSHPDRTKTPGVDMTTGSLGQGTSAAAGIAQGFKMKGTDQMVYLIVGDGELNEGQCWEAFQFIAGKALNNCIVFIDDNKKQLDGPIEDVLPAFDYVEKMKAFGFNTVKVKGNDIAAIDEAITNAKAVTDKASCIVLDNIKGSGVPYIENMAANHSIKWNNDGLNNATDEAIAALEKFIKEAE